jgi:uncharacterized protein YecT (DUF1311 family)
MKALVICLVLITTVQSGVCRSKKNPCWDTDTAMAQSEMNRCAAEDASAADAELNRVYQQLLSKLSDDKSAQAKLRAAQRAWVVFRDAQLEAWYPASNKQAYGSIFPMCYAQMRAAITKERAEQLRRMLDGKEPCS